MKLVETEPLAADLEKGLGEAHWMFNAFYPKLRLRMEGTCGVASLAITQHLLEQGYDAETVISAPKLSVDPEMRHVFTIVNDGGPGVIIDSGYTQFLEFAGLTAGYVMLGGKDYFPDPKIESFEVGNTQPVVERLTRIAEYVLDHRDETIDEQMFRTPEFEGMPVPEMSSVFSEIWNPDHFDTYKPTEYMAEAGAKLAHFVVPEHVKLVA